jgi:hypothetical protein
MTIRYLFSNFEEKKKGSLKSVNGLICNLDKEKEKIEKFQYGSNRTY